MKREEPEEENITISKTEYERLSKIEKVFSSITCSSLDCANGHTLSKSTIKLPNNAFISVYSEIGVKCWACKKYFCSKCASRRFREVFCNKCHNEWDSGC